jgi:hypothetical protein
MTTKTPAGAEPLTDNAELETSLDAQGGLS